MMGILGWIITFFILIIASGLCATSKCIIENKKRYDFCTFVFLSSVACIFILGLIYMVFNISEMIFEEYGNCTNKLEYKDCLNTVTQLFTFIGSTSIAAISLYLSFGKKNNKQINEKPVNEDSKSE